NSEKRNVIAKSGRSADDVLPHEFARSHRFFVDECLHERLVVVACRVRDIAEHRSLPCEILMCSARWGRRSTRRTFSSLMAVSRQFLVFSFYMWTMSRRLLASPCQN